jgi:hypothetical protein
VVDSRVDINDAFLDVLAAKLPPRSEPLVLPWPAVGNLGAFRSFASAAEWKACIGDVSLRPQVPLIVTAKYARAQKLYLVGWLDADFIKAGELVALTALELALNDRYGGIVPARGKPKKIDPNKPPKDQGKNFSDMLDHIVTGDGLTDDQLPSVQKYGGSIVELIKRGGTTKPSLADIRNELAHGAPFGGMPKSGLLEVVRDLIHYAYRNF